MIVLFNICAILAVVSGYAGGAKGTAMRKTAKFLSPKQIRYLAETAEQARAALSHFAGYEVGYDAVALQLLDEWIDRHMRQFPKPSPRMRLLWVSFLGEMFRRRHGGEWVIEEGEANKGELALLCPTESGGVRKVDVSGQVGRRIAEGMSASLAYFYAMASIELKMK